MPVLDRGIFFVMKELINKNIPAINRMLCVSNGKIFRKPRIKTT